MKGLPRSEEVRGEEVAFVPDVLGHGLLSSPQISVHEFKVRESAIFWMSQKKSANSPLRSFSSIDPAQICTPSRTFHPATIWVSEYRSHYVRISGKQGRKRTHVLFVEREE